MKDAYPKLKNWIKMEIIPSILGLTDQEIEEQIAQIDADIPILHFDVMDGQFVSKKTPDSLFDLIPRGIVVDFHLMADNPLKYIDKLPKNTRYVFVHSELDTKAIEQFIHQANEKKMSIGLVLNPNSTPEILTNYADHLDAVLLMSVEPGSSGQAFQDIVSDKITKIKLAYPNLEIIVDGGINAHTLEKIKGADAAIVHAAIFDTGIELKLAIAKLYDKINELKIY